MKKMTRREIEVLFQFLIDRFQRNKKRLPFHVRDLKDFFQSEGHQLDFSEFYFLEIKPISREGVRVKYSTHKNPYKFYSRNEYLFDSIEIVVSSKGSTKENELFPEPKVKNFM